MAKGDDKRARNRIDQMYGRSQNTLNNLETNLGSDRNMFMNNYNNAYNRQIGQDYTNIMNNYGGMAQTGGFTPQGIQAMRARGNAANRGLMDMAQRNINRFGGPGKVAALSRLARDTGQNMSDANVNTEANLAQLVQQGKLAGMGGMLNAYAATPGQVNMFGNQLQQNTQQQLGQAGLQNQLGLGTMNAQIEASKIPGRWENFAQRFKDVAGMAGTVMGAFPQSQQLGGLYGYPPVPQQNSPYNWL